MTERRFTGRVVVVTGASRGLGRAIAAAFHEEGARVIGTRTGSGQEHAGERAECDQWIEANFESLAAIDACAQQVRHLEPDILINNAGINRIAPFVEVSHHDFQRIHHVNVLAPLRLCQAAIPAMVRRGWGRIVNVSSIWGKISKAHRASYSSSKFAIDGMTVALAAEHTADGVLANSVAPGFIDTELTRTVLSDAERTALVAQVPARRLGQPDEVARLVRWLASEENTYISGQNIAIDGGFTRV